MERTVYSQIKPELVMPPEQRVFPDPDNTGYIPELIERLGGVDIAFGEMCIRDRCDGENQALSSAQSPGKAKHLPAVHRQKMKFSAAKFCAVC